MQLKKTNYYLSSLLFKIGLLDSFIKIYQYGKEIEECIRNVKKMLKISVLEILFAFALAELAKKMPDSVFATF